MGFSLLWMKQVSSCVKRDLQDRGSSEKFPGDAPLAVDRPLPLVLEKMHN
jgi:hypothetical protein|tara:strand:+ start:432 stop:581 length:150 start_codon:yes stop_codon:yes gene_type:complete